jgi:uncharacterized protein YvpB
MKYFLQTIGLLFVFFGTVLKEASWTRRRFLRHLYWPVGAVGVVVGVIGVYLDHKETRLRDATALADQGRLTFHSGLDNRSMPSVEDAIRQLTTAQKTLAELGDSNKRLQATHDLALAQERLAYGDSPYGCTFRRDDTGNVYSCRRHSGASIYVVPRGLEGWNIRCTDVAEPAVWKQAHATYDSLASLILSRRSGDSPEEVARASRSAGYFYLCDRLLFGSDEVANAEQLLRVTERVTSTNGMIERNGDAQKKLLFVNAAKRLSTGAVACTQTCPDDQEPNTRYFEFRGDQLTAFKGDHTVFDNGVQTLPACGEQNVGRLISDVIRPPRSFNSAVLSWDATTPPGSWIEFRIKVRIDGNWTKEYKLGDWSSDDEAHRGSFDGQKDASGDVNVDQLLLKELADSLQVVVELHRGERTSRTRANAGAPQLRAVSVILKGPQDPIPKLSPLRAAVDLEVPQYSQMLLSHGDVLCSPTSLSMVLDYWARELNIAGIHRPVGDVASHVNDPHYGAGNWSFNVAYASQAGGGALRAFVTRLASIEQLERLLTEGLPVVASIRWKPNALHGAPIPLSNGHLVVVRGFQESGDVVVNDPAAATDREVKRVYKRDEFDAAWTPSGRTIYVVRPAGKTLPDEGAFGAW